MGQQLVQDTNSFSYVYAVVIALAILLAVYLLSRKKAARRDAIVLVGERFAGKTQLFIALGLGKRFQTVPSIRSNTCVKVMGGGGRKQKYRLTDYCGDNISKEEILNSLPTVIHTIVHVIDGTDSKKMADAALFIYRVLISKKYQQHKPSYVVMLNKSDEAGFYGKEKIEKRLQDEIQTIKSTRKNQGEDNQAEEDYLKTSKARFEFKKEGIKIVTGSAKTNIKQLQLVLEDICG